MQTVHYKRGNMISNAVGCIGLAAGGVWGAFNLHGMTMILGIFFAVSLPIAAIALIVRACGDCVALHFDSASLRVATLFGGATVPWSQIKSMRREVVTQSSAFGLIKQDISHYLVITADDGGGFERTFKVNERLLDWPRDAIPALINDMARAQSSRAPAPPTPRPAAPVRGGFGRRAA